MDFRSDVTNNDDTERRLPPIEQLQFGNNEFFLELADTNDLGDDFFNLDYEHEYDGTDMTYAGLQSNSGTLAQGILQAYNDVTSEMTAHQGSGFDYGHSHGAVVNGYGDPNGYNNFFNDLDVPHDEQTNFDLSAPDNSDHPFPHQNLPQFGSGDLTDYPFPDFSFKNHTHAAGPAPLPAHISGTLTTSLMDQDTTRSALPPTSPPAESSKRVRRRRPASMDSRDTPEPSRVKKQCAGCEKAFYSSKDPQGLRCTRCYDKHVKHTAGHTTYNFNPEMTIDHAWRRLYPNVEPLAPAGDDVEAAKANEQDYIRRLIEAV